ncbi:hypothetical protein RND59_15095 [Vibrio ruber]|uniref:hypothetical protein n=1 Tax=Vibrio ruber TaxID=184755 RepID=UPI002892F3F0|nr:hypothetical protein [Vibrio ruber]WNJ95429.1 hypothetical protein RND59_15095 [Vibrio ruber]
MSKKNCESKNDNMVYEALLERIEIDILSSQHPGLSQPLKGIDAKIRDNWNKIYNERAAKAVIELINSAEDLRANDIPIPHELSYWLLQQFALNLKGNTKKGKISKPVDLAKKILEDRSAYEDSLLDSVILIKGVNTIVYAYYDEMEKIETANKKYVKQIISFQEQYDINDEQIITLSECEYGKLLAHLCLYHSSLAKVKPPKLIDIQKYYCVIYKKEEKTIQNRFKSSGICKKITEHKPSKASIIGGTEALK